MRVTSSVMIATVGSITVTVTPVVPKFYVGKYSRVSIGVTVGWVDTGGASVTINWGDGVVEGAILGGSPPWNVGGEFDELPHIYAYAGTYTINALVQDLATGATGTGTATVTVSTVPTLILVLTPSPSQLYFGQTLTLTVDVDSGYVGPATIGIDWGDPLHRLPLTQTTKTTPPPWVFTQAYSPTGINWKGSVNVVVTLTDQYSGASTSKSLLVPMADSLNGTLKTDKTAGDIPLTIVFSGTITGIGFPPYTYSLDFADGTPSTSGSVLAGAPPFNFSIVAHTYTKVGQYKATVTINDSFTGTFTAGIRIAGGLAGLQTWWALLSPLQKVLVVVGVAGSVATGIAVAGKKGGR